MALWILRAHHFGSGSKLPEQLLGLHLCFSGRRTLSVIEKLWGSFCLLENSICEFPIGFRCKGAVQIIWSASKPGALAGRPGHLISSTSCSSARGNRRSRRREMLRRVFWVTRRRFRTLDPQPLGGRRVDASLSGRAHRRENESRLLPPCKADCASLSCFLISLLCLPHTPTAQSRKVLCAEMKLRHFGSISP